MSTLNTIGLRGRNLIINGALDFWQRGTSSNPIPNSSSVKLADRFSASDYMAASGSMRYDRIATTTSEESSLYAAQLWVQTTQASPAATDLSIWGTVIEGYNYASIAGGKKVTLSFWVMNSLVGTYSVLFNNADNTRCLAKDYTIDDANTWEKKVITFTTCTDGTWNITNGIGLSIVWGLAVGSTYKTAPDTWTSGVEKYGSTNLTNDWFASGNVFTIKGMMLKEGEYSNPAFERAGIDIANELMLCQRYYEKSYDVDTAPGSADNGGACIYQTRTAVAASTAGTINPTVMFRVIKRSSIPAITVYSTNSGTINAVQSSGTDRTGCTVHASYDASGGFSVLTVSNASATVISLDHQIRFHWICDTEL